MRWLGKGGKKEYTVYIYIYIYICMLDRSSKNRGIVPDDVATSLETPVLGSISLLVGERSNSTSTRLSFRGSFF